MKGCTFKGECLNEIACEDCDYNTASNLSTIKLNKPDKYNEYIRNLLDKQVGKGLNKYGFMLQDNPAGIIARLNHLEEELVDALRYIQWIKDLLKEGGEDAT